MYTRLEASYREHLAVYWANLSRLNNLLIILNVSLFFLTGLVSQGYFYTFFSIGCFFAVAVLSILPLTSIRNLWFYGINLVLEFAGIYFLMASVDYWVRTGAQIGP